jgi:multiple sugar transport system permease protein
VSGRGTASRRWATSARLALLVVGSLVMVVPFLYMLSTSFKPHVTLFQLPPQFIPHPATLDNYRTALGSNDFGRYFVNSLVVAVVSTVIAVLLSSMMAFAFARFDFPGQSVAFWLLLLGLMVPAMMLLVPQFLLAKNLHLIDSLAGLVVFYVAGNLALNTFLLRGFFEEIPRELEEAMIVDGAGSWRRYAQLIMPLSRPALATVGIFTFLASWDEFTWALTIIEDPGKRTLPIAISLFQGQHLTDWGIVFAAAVIAIAPVIVVFVTFQRQLIAGLGAGALKG